MRIKTLLICITTVILLPVGSYAKSSLLNYYPEKYIVDEKFSKILRSVDWHNKDELESIPDNELESVLRASFCKSGEGYFPIKNLIGQKKIIDLSGEGNYSIILWLNIAAVVYFGAIIARESDTFVIYYFGRDISIEDIDNDGKYEIKVYYPIIYKAWEFFEKGDLEPTIFWYDIFTYDGRIEKVNQKHTKFYSEVLGQYKKGKKTIEQFDVGEYSSHNKYRFADPKAYEKGLVENKIRYIECLSDAIKTIHSLFLNLHEIDFSNWVSLHKEITVIRNGYKMICEFDPSTSIRSCYIQRKTDKKPILFYTHGRGIETILGHQGQFVLINDYFATKACKVVVADIDSGKNWRIDEAACKEYMRTAPEDWHPDCVIPTAVSFSPDDKRVLIAMKSFYMAGTAEEAGEFGRRFKLWAYVVDSTNGTVLRTYQTNGIVPHNWWKF